MMKFITGLAMTFAIFVTLVGGISPGTANPGWYSYWDNTTDTTTTTSVVHGNSTSATITTSRATDHTISANSSVQTPFIGLYSLKAAVDDKTMVAHYSFQFAIEPHLNAMQCNASAPAADGNLVDIKVAKCWQPEDWRPYNSYPMPAQFSFAWRNMNNGTVIVLRSTSPGSANACPEFPYDACWAQGLYWVPHDRLVKKNDTEKYVGPSVVVLNGTYCKSGMEECTWSEYLY